MCAKLLVLALAAVIAAVVSGEEAVTYTVEDTNNKTCLYLKSAIHYHIPGQKINLTGSFLNTTTHGNCSKEFAFITIETSDSPTVSVQLTFTSNGTVWLGSAMLVKVAGKTVSMPSFAEVTAPVGNIYECNLSVPLNITSKLGHGSIRFSNLALQPFGIVNNTISSEVSRCPGHRLQYDNIVPIAVGAALCLLVLIVIVSYLVGRSRVAHSGYRAVDGEGR